MSLVVWHPEIKNKQHCFDGKNSLELVRLWYSMYLFTLSLKQVNMCLTEAWWGSCGGPWWHQLSSEYPLWERRARGLVCIHNTYSVIHVIQQTGQYSHINWKITVNLTIYLFSQVTGLCLWVCGCPWADSLIVITGRTAPNTEEELRGCGLEVWLKKAWTQKVPQHRTVRTTTTATSRANACSFIHRKMNLENYI